jgi:hypothetical protein
MHLEESTVPIFISSITKFSSLRTGMWYIFIGGLSQLNLSSNAKLVDDNLQQRFKGKIFGHPIMVQFGIDIFSGLYFPSMGSFF